MKIDSMTLQELKDEKRDLLPKLLSDDCTSADAKRFKQLLDSIRYIQEVKDLARKANPGPQPQNPPSPKRRYDHGSIPNFALGEDFIHADKSEPETTQ